MLVWKGKIIEKIDTACPHGDYLCEFSCPEIGPFRLRVCSRLFVERSGNNVEIPMEFQMGDRVYSTATEKTPVSNPVGDWNEA